MVIVVSSLAITTVTTSLDANEKMPILSFQRIASMRNLPRAICEHLHFLIKLVF
jgi:hypothetical protein